VARDGNYKEKKITKNKMEKLGLALLFFGIIGITIAFPILIFVWAIWIGLAMLQ
jgi:hypothetical protein